MLLLGIVAPVACVCVAFAVAATVFFRRQWTRAETRRLHLTVKLSGLAVDEEVASLLSVNVSMCVCIRITRRRNRQSRGASVYPFAADPVKALHFPILV